jgi:hypothetical protein
MNASRLFDDWVRVDMETELSNGVYEIEGGHDGRDDDLPQGHIEIYDHPIRGQSFWDGACDDGTDFAGHVSIFWLLGRRVRRVYLPNRSTETAST